MFLIRAAVKEDVISIRKLFADTIRETNADDYTEKQIEVWASGADLEERWLEKFADQNFFVAEMNNQLAGFSSVTTTGYIDFLFVHPGFQKQKIGAALLQRIERWALKEKIRLLNASVSITAKTFFESNQFSLMNEQTVEVNGIHFINYTMFKLLSSR